MKSTLRHTLNCCIIASLMLTGSASALSPAQKSLLDSNIRYYDIEASAQCGGSEQNTTLTGSENAEKIYNFFITKGLKPWQAAGIMGNMKIESNLEPQRLQKTPPGTITPAESFSGGLGWGLVQWTPGSKFIDTQTPKSKANDLTVQLDFLWEQLEGRGPLPEKQAGDDVKAAPNVREAVLAFQGNKRVGGNYTGFERPADQSGSVGERTAEAEGFLAKYGSNVPSAATSGAIVNSCADSGSLTGNAVVGDFSLPVDKKWFVEHREWFTKPHHDYPSSDIPVPTGTPIYAVAGGKITKAPNQGGYGIGVTQDVGNGIIFIYGHGIDGGSLPGAKQGDVVKAGQRIMSSGNTGQSSGPHLHFQIKVDGQNVCPQNLLVALGDGKPVPDIRSLPRSGCSY
ncbi:MAG TPA: phage tail tip lysozyme [Candidatus Limnocylindrales bacterium]|nr:phage tail tip lysozyme [Candidatus Limnocylindrales bacterium]